MDFLAVNHITDEYYWCNEDKFVGWIGWEYVPEDQLNYKEKELIMSGYKETQNPFKIEQAIFVFIILFVLLLILYRRKKKAYNTA